jgi:murein DD-endopeptidase MepM/ murein hydrolase activator NlpD
VTILVRIAGGGATLWAMRFRLAVALALILVTTLAPSAAQAAPVGAKASARALALRVISPGGDVETIGEASAPPSRLVRSKGFTYGDGIITTGATWARAQATASDQAAGSGTSTVRTLSLFGGEITVGAMSTRAIATASSKRATGGLSGSWLADVTILGTKVRATPNARIPLGDWGYVVLLEQAVVRESKRIGRRTFVSGLHVHLTAEHGGLHAGTEIVVGYAEAAASAPRPAKTEDPPDKPGVPVAPTTGPSHDPDTTTGNVAPPVVTNPPAYVRPQLTADGYVFPLYGPSSFTNDFQGARALTGWHHGNDIFAPVGTPVLAVTDGTLFLVGWNDLGGNRLWLRDSQGNEFYYAHLSAYTPLAYEGSQVKAGDVIGFVGATGDAVGTPPHLHFEIHPAALLGLGYDGVINPYDYLLAWRRVADASFDWVVKAGKVPQPGVVVIQAEDISSASGLAPGALSGLMELPSVFGERSAQTEQNIVGADAGFAGTGTD